MDGVFKTDKRIVHIVGGGVHGCFMAIALQYELGLSPAQIRMYDPCPRLLHNWFERSRSCRMTFLRSNSSHSIHVSFNSLRSYTQEQGIDPWNSELFAMPYHRPSLKLFNEHALFCLKQYRLDTMHVRQRVESLLPEGGLSVSGKNIRGLVIYTGNNTRLYMPQWAGNARTAGNVRVHVFSDAFYKDIDDIPSGALIVGGGISALQLAIALAQNGKSPCLVHRRPIEVFRFDFNPCYTGPRCQKKLEMLAQSGSAQSGSEQRMDTIRANRFAGTVPQEIFDTFNALVKEKAAEAEIIPDEAALEERAQSYKTVIFCTGFDPSPNADPLLQSPAQKFVAGYPVLGKDLQWGNGVFIGGHNAMYRVGPAAPNIIGAHLAWRIIKQQLLKIW